MTTLRDIPSEWPLSSLPCLDPHAMLESADRLKVISRVKAIVVKHHFNIGNVDYADWSSAVDEQIPTLLMADENTFDEGVRNLLRQLKSSHTISTDRIQTQSCLNIPLALRSVQFSSAGAPQWMFLDVFEDSPAAQAVEKYLVNFDQSSTTLSFDTTRGSFDWRTKRSEPKIREW